MPTASELVSMGYGGYAGWGDVEAAADFAATGGSGKKTTPSGGGGGNGTISNVGDATSYLNAYQNDPYLSSLVSKYGGGILGEEVFTVPENYAGFSLNQIAQDLEKQGKGGIGRTDILGSFLGIDPNKPLEAGQIFKKSQVPSHYQGSSSEWQGLVKAFGNPAAPQPTGGQAALERPQPINRVELYKAMREEYGVAELEDYVNSLRSLEESLYADLRTRTRFEEGKTVPLGAIAGRVGEIERQQFERIDEIRRLKQTAVDELNTKYSVINTMINFAGLDYQDAVQAYNDEFQRNIAVYGLIMDRAEFQLGIDKAKNEEARYQQQIASANYQTMVNAILNGNTTFDQLPAETKLQLRKLEAQAGLPAGFAETLRINPKDQVLFQTSNEGITQVGFIGSDGKVRVEEYGRRISSSGGSVTERAATKKQSAYDEMSTWLSDKGGNDRFVSASEWNFAKSQWVQQGYGADEFDDAFRYTHVGDAYRDDIDFDEFNLSN